MPSYNVNTQPISDAATIVRPANLRGLAPDHTLVLVNGKRRHRAAVIYWLGNGVADGAQGPDISAIPSSASEAGGGPARRRLRAVRLGRDRGRDELHPQRRRSRRATSRRATAATTQATAPPTRSAATSACRSTQSGFANFSFEYGESDPTDRSIQRDDAAALIAAGNTAVKDPAQVWGSPEIAGRPEDCSLNCGVDLSARPASSTATGTTSPRPRSGGFYFRNPNTRAAVFSADGGETLLIGDSRRPDDADAVPDGHDHEQRARSRGPGAVFADPNCFSFQEMFPGGFTPQFGGDVDGLLGRRRARAARPASGVLGRERGLRLQPRGLLHHATR